ncbi:MAG TPA: hypothetical protein VMT35_14590 [Ignavibacteriaceae bacterium]|nr:hypothetical protein [Ignavibacteriaceae bacterium]
MEIKKIIGNQFFPKEVESKKSPKEEKPASLDKLDLSSEAKSLAAEKAKNFDEIKTKIDEKFYSRSDIIRLVSDAILKSLTK